MSIDCVIKCHSSSAALTSGQYYENTWLENSKSSSNGGNKALTIIKVQDARGLRTSLVISGWAQKVKLLYPDNLCCLRFNLFILFSVQTQEGFRVSASGYCSVQQIKQNFAILYECGNSGKLEWINIHKL